MTDATDRIKVLILKHLKGELQAGEHDELQAWVRSSDGNRAIFDQLSDPDRLEQYLKEFHEAKVNIRAKIEAGIRKSGAVYGPGAEPLLSPVPVFPIVRKRPWLYAAASVVLLLGAGYLLWPHRPTQPTITATTSPAKNDVAPGTNKALLTLANGSTIVLENAVNGNLSRQGNSNIVKNNNQLTYTATTSHGLAASPEVTFNTLTTPRAGQFRLVLPDGTKVWLNNASSLRYPTSFTGSRREVQLSGEAYFEVAKNVDRSFTVLVEGGLAVNVLGTSFNVMAYADEPAVKTTLITGKVELSEGGQQSLLLPGEQSVMSRDGARKIMKGVDTAEAIAWKLGYFHFAHAGIADVLRQLSRWYDVEVEFTIPVPDYPFDGEIGRDLSLSTILRHLEKRDLHFRIEGKKLIVSK